MDLQKSKLTLTNGPDSPRRQRAINFIQNLGRRLGRSFQNDLIYSSNDDMRTSSTNYDAFSFNNCCNCADEQNLTKTLIHSSSCDISTNSEISCFNSSDSKLLSNKKSSVSRVLQNLSPTNKLNSSSKNRSNSCTNTPLKQEKSKNQINTNISSKISCDVSKTKQQKPQRILRQPVNYVYLKGMSGLPTRRVPISSLCCNYLPR